MEGFSGGTSLNALFGGNKLRQQLHKSALIIRLIYTYVIMKGRFVCIEQRKTDFRLLQRFGWREIIARLQKFRLYGARGSVVGRGRVQSLKNKRFIFVVGFHKNGTRSIHTYLEALGMKGVHWPVFINTGIDYEYILGPIAEDPRQCVEALAPLFAEYDFFSDVPFPGLFREMAELFPKSKFILTRRPPQEWGESIWRHWRRWEPVGTPHKLTVFEAVQYHLPVSTEINKSDLHCLIERYVTHNQAVQDCFSGTGRLLTADLNDPDLNEHISEFLGFASAPPFPKIRAGWV